jgi:hypothetical protein
MSTSARIKAWLDRWWNRRARWEADLVTTLSLQHQELTSIRLLLVTMLERNTLGIAPAPRRAPETFAPTKRQIPSDTDLLV